MVSPPTFKQLQPPRQRQLYTDPIKDILTNKKIKLHTNINAFIFFIKKPNNIFLEYKRPIIRINKLLKQYTEEEETRQQFIKLLEQPQIIQDKQTTLFIIEIIYIMSFLLSIDLLHYIDFLSLNNLINYYFIKHRLKLYNVEPEEEPPPNKNKAIHTEI